MSSWFENPGFWAYALSASAYAWLVARLVGGWQTGRKPALLLGIAVSTSVFAAAAAAYSALPGLWLGWLTSLLDFVRVAFTVVFLLVLLGPFKSASGRPRVAEGWSLTIALAVVLLVGQFVVGVRPPGLLEANSIGQRLGYVASLGVAVLGLVLVEQIYRRTQSAVRWDVRPMYIGLAGLFALDVALYSDALLFRVMDFDLWAARGFAHAATVPFILTTLRRRRDWSFELSLSRGLVTGSTTLLLTGGYLLVVATAGIVLRQFGGSWGRALETALGFAALLLLAVVALSGTFRAKVRVLVAKHFFTYRFDYREQWLRLTSTLSSDTPDRPWAACISALANLVESPGGALWFRMADGTYRQVDRSGALPPATEPVPDDGALPTFLRRTGWVIDVQDALKRPASYEGLVLPPDIANAENAWLLVPLQTSQDLVGFVVIATPRVRVELDWEVRDLLKTAGRQAAGYLAYARATEDLLEAQKFEAFHRMSTFVVHDLKNLVAQLQLLLSNAERHRENPDFQRDMLKTVNHVASRMYQLILQLKPEASPRDRAQLVDVSAIVRRVQALRLGSPSGLSVDAPSSVFVWGHDDLLERVIAHLVQNGFDASEGIEDVWVRVAPVGDEVLVEVGDRGSGMTAEFLRDRLFKPFQTTKATGMGIGMYECRQYVQQVGGRIDVQSAPDEGTRVAIHLRAVRPAQTELGVAA